MTIAETEVKLTHHAIVLLGEADGLTVDAPVLVPHSAVVTFCERDVEVLADRSERELEVLRLVAQG
jgi:hypothetical protein